MKVLIDLLKSPEFIGKAFLLLINAALTGILVPEISAQLSENRFKEQKIFEAELQRQREILAAQNELLSTLSERLWEFQLLNIDVSFYKANGNEKAYVQSVEIYQSKSAKILGLIRTDLSKSKRLISPSIQDKLSTLYFETLLPIDSNLEMLILKGSAAEMNEWHNQHDNSFGKAQNRIDNFLTVLAIELKLTASTSLTRQ